MKVCHFVETFSKNSETFIYEYVKGTEQLCVDGHVLTMNRENKEKRPYQPVNSIDKPSKWNVRNVVGNISKRLNIGGLSTWPLLRERVERQIKSIDPDVIHAHFGPSGAIVFPIAQSLEIPLVVSFYGVDASKLLSHPVISKEYKKLWSSSVKVLVLSREMGERLARNGCPKSKQEIIRLGRSIDKLEYNKPKPPLRDFISVGRLVEKKGHIDTIKAFHKSVNKYPDIRLKIIGGGPLYSTLEDKIQELGISGSVNMTGKVSNKTVLEEMKRSDAFILCSKDSSDGDKEGTPTVFIEAQAMGLPCIGTDHAGIPEMIPKKNQFLLSGEGNVAQIAQAISNVREFDTAKASEVSISGRKKMEKEFDIRTISRQICEVYNTLVK